MRIRRRIHGPGRLSDCGYRNTLQETCHVGKNPHASYKDRRPGVLTLPHYRSAHLQAVSARGPEKVISKVECVGGENIWKRHNIIQLLKPRHIDRAVHAVGFGREELSRVNAGTADRPDGGNSVTDDRGPNREGILIGPRKSRPSVVDNSCRNHALPLGQEVMTTRVQTRRPERNVDALLT